MANAKQAQMLRLMKRIMDALYLLERPVTFLILSRQTVLVLFAGCFIFVTGVFHVTFSYERRLSRPNEAIDLRLFVFFLERIAMLFAGLSSPFYAVAKFIIFVTNGEFLVTNLRLFFRRAVEAIIDEYHHESRIGNPNPREQESTEKDDQEEEETDDDEEEEETDEEEEAGTDGEEEESVKTIGRASCMASVRMTERRLGVRQTSEEATDGKPRRRRSNRSLIQ